MSSWASVFMSSHCSTPNSITDSAHAQMDHSQHMQMQNQASSQDANDHADCDCGCNGEINCSVSGCSVTALSGSVVINTIKFNQPIAQAVATLTVSQYPNLLFRPPIILS